MQLIGLQTDFHETSEGLVLEHSQAIDGAFLDRLKAERENSLSVREGNFMRVASIPVAVVEKWQREGFNLDEHTAKQILARLRIENLDAFITTNKEV